MQSTPHLLAWLYFLGRLQDSDKGTIVAELASLNRSLQPHIDNAYQEALRCRLMARSSHQPPAAVPDNTPPTSAPTGSEHPRP